MDIQQAFLSKVIHGEDILRAVNARITPDFLSDERYRRIYEYLLEHWRKYGEAPDLAVVKQAFPAYPWPQHRQSLDYFIDRLRERRHRSIMVDALQDAAAMISSTDPDPEVMDRVDEVIRSALIKVRMETTPTTDINLRTAYADIVRLLEDRMENPGFLRGISTGFKGIDRVTGGWQPEQFVVLMGLPKAMKSSTLLYMAMECHAQAKVPLFLGFEMGNIEQIDRMLSLYAQVGLTALMNGTINPIEHRRVLKAAKQLEGMRDLILSVDMENAMNVSGVQAKIMEYQPDVVFIDGAYLMQSEASREDSGSAAALTDVARSLKKLAQAQKIPIVVTTQATMTRTKGGRLRADSAMYTQAWRQSADVLLGVERDDPEASDVGEVIIRIKVLDSRSGPRGETALSWNWSAGAVSDDDPSIFTRRPDDDDD